MNVRDFDEERKLLAEVRNGALALALKTTAFALRDSPTLELDGALLPMFASKRDRLLSDSAYARRVQGDRWERFEVIASRADAWTAAHGGAALPPQNGHPSEELPPWLEKALTVPFSAPPGSDPIEAFPRLLARVQALQVEADTENAGASLSGQWQASGERGERFHRLAVQALALFDLASVREWELLDAKALATAATAKIAGAEARAAEAEADMHAARKEAAERREDAIIADAEKKAEAAARERAEKWAREEAAKCREIEADKAAALELAEEWGRMLAKLEAKLDTIGVNTREAAQAAHAAEAAVREEGEETRRRLELAEARLARDRGNVDADCVKVEAFVRFEKALKDEAGGDNPPGKNAIMGGVLDELRAEGYPVSFLGRKGVEYFNEWRLELGRPMTGEAYAKAKKGAGKKG